MKFLRLSSCFFILFFFCPSDCIIQNRVPLSSLLFSSAWSSLMLNPLVSFSTQPLYSSAQNFKIKHIFSLFVDILIWVMHCFLEFTEHFYDTYFVSGNSYISIPLLSAFVGLFCFFKPCFPVSLFFSKLFVGICTFEKFVSFPSFYKLTCTGKALSNQHG